MGQSLPNCDVRDMSAHQLIADMKARAAFGRNVPEAEVSPSRILMNTNRRPAGFAFVRAVQPMAGRVAYKGRPRQVGSADTFAAMQSDPSGLCLLANVPRRTRPYR